MGIENNLIKIFAGKEATAILLKTRLKETGINALIKNDTSTAFLGTYASVVDLYVQERDLKDAMALIIEFTKEI
jgi:hypothetical protein